MTRTRWIIFAIICVVTLGALVLFSKKDSVNVDNIDAAKIISSAEGSLGDQVYGKKDAKLVLFEYGDFQCPGCGGAYAEVKALKEEYKEQIAFVYRHFPLTSIHPNALAAATVAEAAGLQGKFWEMHDKLFENQNAWSNIDPNMRTDLFVGYAGNLGLDIEKFRADLSNRSITEKINRDRALGNKLGVSSTPTFYLNDQRLSEEEVMSLVQGDGELVRKKIDAELKKLGVEGPVKEEAKAEPTSEAQPEQ